MKTKTTISNSLKKRLKAYSMTAGAVAAGITSVNAQVDYTDLDPDGVASNTDSVYLDLNNDGTDDFVFIASAGTYGSGSFNVYRNFVVSLNDNQVVGNATSSGYLYPYAVPNTSIIDGNLEFNGGSNFQTLGWDYFALSASTAAYTYGNIRVGSGDVYVGLQLDVNSSSHYGWARISLDLGGTLTVKDYAYEQTACLGIEAGATTGGLTPTAAPAASNIMGADVGDTGTGADLSFSFDVATSEDGVSEYRVFAVKTGVAFDLAAAQAVPAGSYVSSSPTGASISGNFGANTDTDGDAIMNDIDYDIYVLSMNDCANAQSDALSASSESIQINPPVGINELNEFGYKVFTDGNSLFVNTNSAIESLVVTSIDGKTVFNSTNLKGNQRIDMTSASGLYLVNIKMANGIYSEKIFLN